MQTAVKTLLKGHKGDIDSVEIAKDDANIVVTCSSEDATCRLWDLRSSGRVVRCLARLPGLTHAVLNGPLLFAVDAQGEALQIDTRADTLVVDGSARVVWRRTLGTEVVNQVDLATDGAVAVCCDDNGTVHALQASTGVPVCAEKKIHTSLATSVSCRPNSSEVVSVGTGGFHILCQSCLLTWRLIQIAEFVFGHTARSMITYPNPTSSLPRAS
jgi:WD40 repeat protein